MRDAPEIPAMPDHDEDYATTTYYDRANRPYLAVGPKVDYADATAEGHPATLSVFDPNGNVLQTHTGVYAAPPPAGTSPDPDDFLATEAQRQNVANTYLLPAELTSGSWPD